MVPHQVLLAQVPDVLDDPADRQQDGPPGPHIPALHPHLPRITTGMLQALKWLVEKFEH